MRKVSTEEKLIQINEAVLRLLEKREATDISMYDVANECGISTSTIYHHYPNIENLFQSLLNDVFDDFDLLSTQCINEEKIFHWTDINQMIETACVEYYNNNAVAKKLILGRHTFTGLIHADMDHDLELGKQVEMIYRQFFDIPKLPQSINIFTISLQAADKLYALSYRKYGNITPELAKEALRLTESYLKLYIPPVCPKIHSLELNQESTEQNS